LGYIGIVQHKEHSPEVLHIPPGTPCIYIYIYIYIFRLRVDAGNIPLCKHIIYKIIPTINKFAQ